MGQPGQMDNGSLSSHARFTHAGHLTRHGRDPEGLEKILRSYFKAPVKLVSNVPQWMPLSTREQAQLGAGRRMPRMGESAFLGVAVRDVQHKFRIEIGPLSAEEYNRFLPGEAWVTELRDWVRQYAGVEFEWETRVILRADAVQGATLGSHGRLGYNTAGPSAAACPARRSGVSRRAVILPYTESLLMETNMSEISRAVLFGKLDTLLFTSLESATAFCKLRGNPMLSWCTGCIS